MEQKNYTEVLIDGTIYTLGGVEEESYLRKVAAYLNEKIGKIKKQDGFLKQNADYQNLTIHLNIADDYFKEQERADILAEQKASLEKDAYSLKHELITTQMKLDAVLKELETERRKLSEAQQAVESEVQKAETAEAKAAQHAAEAELKKNRAAARAAASDRHKAEALKTEVLKEEAQRTDAQKAEEEKQKALQAAAAALAGKQPHHR